MPAGEFTNFIIDASFVLARLLPDEKSLYVDKIFNEFAEGKIKFFAPPILPLEIINGLKYAYPKRITEKQATKLIEDFIEFGIEYLELDLKFVFEISVNQNLSVYDASYVYLSKREKLPLLTMDEKLKNLK